jgi:hypothetical protein
MSANPSGHLEEGPLDPRRACRQRGAFRPEYATDVRDAPGLGGIAGHRWLEGEYGGDNRRRRACGDRNPPSRRARDRHLCGQWPCQERWGDHLEYEADAGAGSFIYVSPFVPHQEINPADEASKWVIVRNGHDRSSSISSPSTKPKQRPQSSLTPADSPATDPRPAEIVAFLEGGTFDHSSTLESNSFRMGDSFDFL